MPTMTMKQWKTALGRHIPLEQVPDSLGMPQMQVLQAVNSGKLRMHTFKSGDGRVFRMVRTRDIEAYKQLAARPKITLAGMKRAFEEMIETPA